MDIKRRRRLKVVENKENKEDNINNLFSEYGEYIDYINFVIKKVKYIREQLSIIHGKPDINTTNLKKIIQDRSYIFTVLFQEIRVKKRKLKELKLNYKSWFNIKYAETRNELNPISLPGTKWASKSDIEAEVIRVNNDDYLSKNREINELESEVNTIQGLATEWGNITFDINNLVKILTLESYNDIDPTSKL